MDILKEFLAFLFFLAFCSQAVFSQGGDNDAPYQREAIQRGEERGTRRADEAFDVIVGNKVVRPRGRPHRNQVRDLYREQKEDLISSAEPSQRRRMREDSKRMTYKPNMMYLSPGNWTGVKDDRTCCPPIWNYGCASESLSLPCFRRSYGGRRPQWCCPFWPEVTVHKCKCRRCAILKPKCAKEGKCRRRYRHKQFYAVCYENSSWSKIRHVNMKLPSSCYCLANN